MKHPNPFLENDKPDFDFDQEVTARANAIATAKSKNGLATTKKRMANKKVHMNLTITEELKNQLFEYADSQGMSASIVVQMLIKKYCK